MDQKTFRQGKVIFREGDLGKTFYQILSGTAVAYQNYGEKQQLRLNDMKTGQFFGEMAVIEAWPRSATVIAEEPVTALEIQTGELNSFFEKQPDQIYALMKQLGDRIRSLTADYQEASAFLKNRETAGAQEKEGFLARVMRFLKLDSIAGSDADGITAEEAIGLQAFVGKGAALPVISLNAGDVVFRQGDRANCMYSVQSGSVGIYVGRGTPEEKELTVLLPNTFLGEMGMLAEEPRSATAVALEKDTELEIIRPEDLEQLFRTNPLEVDMILRHLSNRLRMLTRDYARVCGQIAGES